jgi:hypothetical protein
MTVTVTLQFATAAIAHAALGSIAGLGNVVPTSHTVAQALSPAPAEPAATPPVSAAQSSKALDWDADVLPAMKSYAAKVSKADFAAFLGTLGVQNVPPIKTRPDLWAGIMQTCAI